MTIDEDEKIKTVVENKDYIVQLVNTIEKTLIEAFENLKIEDVNMFQLGYNKAIDDFVEHIRTYYTLKQEMGYVATTYKDLINYIFELAEQLKEGGNIELPEHSESQSDRTGKQKATIEAESKTERQKRDILLTPRR